MSAIEYSEALEQQIAMSRWMATQELDPDDAYREQPFSDNERRLLFQGAWTTVKDGTPFYWSPELCEMLHHVQETMPDWTMTADALLVPTGFCWFGQPIPLPTSSDEYAMTAFGWYAHTSNVLFTTFVAVPERTAGVPMLTGTWAAGESLSHILSHMARAKRAAPEFTATQIRIMAAAWAFMAQRILVAPPHETHRAARRRAQRDGWQHDPTVRVVELRRKSPHRDEHDRETVEWSCQWIVRGHWRQQYYASTNTYRPLWITPYVKGPTDKPLREPKTNLFAVVR